MKWSILEQKNQLNNIIEESAERPVLIFKHSTRCSISLTALHRVESKWAFHNNDVSPFLLNVITHREISKHVEEKFNVKHESPQVLIIKEGKCVFTTSHFGISISEIENVIDK